ncbi:MAG: tagatose-bisphosphate aldolase [Deltaproteobacteria bacterium RIFCSPLOWO2_02_FULL_46_8]|nr:MAG: tagatose-bisphosphate aldolase [Deltaproteobacteria bacterium RIFCSPLOWO2_02_FULL_46_8]
MATAMTAGKLKHMEKVANQKGVIAAAAMDQRGSLQKSIAKAKGVDPKEISWEQMAEFKTAVTKILTPHASAILLDPEYGIEAAKQRSKNAGLLLAYESSGYDNTGPGRLPILMPTWTVSQLKEAGANAIKILFYYNPFEQKEINETKKAWVERIGVECAYQDIPYFLEFVGYDTKGGDGKDIGYAKLKPEIVIKSMEEFSKDRYHVDVLKVEIPVNLQYTKGTKACKNNEAAYDKKEAIALYKKAAKATTKPFIYLSAGVSDEEFRESLELACEADVKWSGVLCGRATWQDGIPVYAKSGVKALESWLSDRGVQNIKALNSILEKGATSWKK